MCTSQAYLWDDVLRQAQVRSSLTMLLSGLPGVWVFRVLIHYGEALSDHGLGAEPLLSLSL